MRVPVNQYVEVGGSLELPLGVRSQPTTFIARPIVPACVRAAVRQATGPVWMEKPERLDCPLIAHDRANHPIAAIFLVAQSVAVLDAQSPAGNGALPRSDTVFDSHILAQDLSAPAIVIASDPEDVDAAITQLGEGGEGAKAATGYDRFPLEPEVEQITVDDQRLRLALQTAEKRDKGSLDLWTGDADVRVRDDIAGRVEHGTSY